MSETTVPDFFDDAAEVARLATAFAIGYLISEALIKAMEAERERLILRAMTLPPRTPARTPVGSRFKCGNRMCVWCR